MRLQLRSLRPPVVRAPVYVLLLSMAGACAAQTQLISSVIDKKTAQAEVGLTAADFKAVDDKAERKVQAVEFTSEPVDAMLLVDASLMGEAAEPIAHYFIDQMQPKEEMAIVEYSSSADLIQDFTSSRELLRRALGRVKYGNPPQALDALYATIDGGFSSSTYRRVIFLLTTGYEGDSRVTDKAVIRLAQKNGVSICPIYMVGAERGLFESLAAHTGGASFRIHRKDQAMARTDVQNLVKAVRAHYLVTIEGERPPGEKFRLTVDRPGLFVSALPVE